MTLAHELGHGVHGWLSRKQTLFNYDTPLTTAETASVFGEFLVFDHLLAAERDPRVQLALLCGKIEDAFATVFRQGVLTRFEQAVFASRKAGRFTSDGVCRLWLDANRPYYGDAVELTDGYRWGWSYIPHFIHSRFYCYSYVFGELLVLSLYRQYKEQGASFIRKYIALLEAGSDRRRRAGALALTSRSGVLAEGIRRDPRARGAGRGPGRQPDQRDGWQPGPCCSLTRTLTWRHRTSRTISFRSESAGFAAGILAKFENSLTRFFISST
jgi:hypothetical protein